MSVRIVRTRSNEDVICDLYEVTTQEEPDKAVGFQMKNPYSVWITAPKNEGFVDDDGEGVTTKISDPSINFEPWAPLSKNKDIMLKLDEVVTAYEAHDEIVEKYNQLIEVENGRGNEDGAGEAGASETAT
jgi:hypothetical protein